MKTMGALHTNRKILLLLAVLLVIGVALTVGVYLYVRSLEVAKPSWLKLGAYVTYEQFFVWAGHNQTEHMTWSITRLRDGLVDLHLSSHGVNVTEDGDVVITSGEANWTIDVVTRGIVDSSDANYIGKKSPFWIETNVTIGSTVDTIYGTSVISESETFYVLGKQRDCWVVDYVWPTSTMKRWYDKPSGILLKTHVVLHRQGIAIGITETAVQTSIDLKS